jgi:hypothetical protein
MEAFWWKVRPYFAGRRQPEYTGFAAQQWQNARELLGHADRQMN